MEIIWLAVALGIGWLLLRYFGGHGGVHISRAKLRGLPSDGTVVVGGSEVRWSAADDDAFAAAWAIPSGHWVAIRVTFDPPGDAADQGEADQGRLDLTVSDRQIASDVEWTDQILDRGLRSDVESVLKALQRRAEAARSDMTRLAAAKPVGERRELE